MVRSLCDSHTGLILELDLELPCLTVPPLVAHNPFGESTVFHIGCKDLSFGCDHSCALPRQKHDLLSSPSEEPFRDKIIDVAHHLILGRADMLHAFEKLIAAYSIPDEA